MNLLLLEPEEILAGRVELQGRRAQHAREVLKVAAEDVLTVGVRGGQVGSGRVVSREPLVLDVTLEREPPTRPGIDLILAMPRPKGLKRIVQAIASLGIDRVLLMKSARVEKSYFTSKVLAPEFLKGLVDLGLEQAKDTIAPTFELRDRFVLPDWEGTKLVLHPGPTADAVAAHGRLVLAIGPDGGWIPAEVNAMIAAGFHAVSLGPRTLRVEVAVPTIVGALRPRLT